MYSLVQEVGSELRLRGVGLQHRLGALIGGGGFGREGSGSGAPSPGLYPAYHIQGKEPEIWVRDLRLGRQGRPRDSGWARLWPAAPSVCPPMLSVCVPVFVQGFPREVHFDS